MKKFITSVVILAAIATGCSKDGNNNDDVNTTDRDFAAKAWMASNFEIEVGQLAATKATNPSIMSYGQEMATEHSASKNQLQAIAADLGIALPDTLDAEQTGLRAQLIDLDGRVFDSVYIHSQVMMHQKMITQLQAEINGGRNNRLTTYASSQMPQEQLHLNRADSIAAGY